MFQDVGFNDHNSVILPSEVVPAPLHLEVPRARSASPVGILRLLYLQPWVPNLIKCPSVIHIFEDDCHDVLEN